MRIVFFHSDFHFLVSGFCDFYGKGIFLYSSYFIASQDHCRKKLRINLAASNRSGVQFNFCAVFIVLL